MPVVRTGRLGPSLPLIALVGLGLMLGTGPARGQGNAIQKGVAFLRASTTQGAPGGGSQLGEQALAGAALLKVGVPPTDPSIVSVLDAVRGRIVGGRYMPERSGGTDIYEAGVVCMFLGNLGNSYTPELQAVASHLISKQKSRRLVGLRRPRGRHRRLLDLAIRRARPLGGGQRRGPGAAERLGEGGPLVHGRPAGRRLDLSPRRRDPADGLDDRRRRPAAC